MAADCRLQVGHVWAIQPLSGVLPGAQFESASESFTEAHFDETDNRAIGQRRPSAQIGDQPQRRRLKSLHVRDHSHLPVHQLRPELEVVEHIIHPGVVEFVGDHVPDVEQAQPAPVGDGSQLLAQPAIYRDLIFRQEQPLERDVARQWQHTTAESVHGRETEDQRQVRAEHLFVFGGDHVIIECSGRELRPVDDLDLGQIAGVEGYIGHAEETRPNPSPVPSPGGEGSSQQVGDGRAQAGERLGRGGPGVRKRETRREELHDQQRQQPHRRQPWCTTCHKQ